MNKVGCPFDNLSILIGTGRIGILNKSVERISKKKPIGAISFLNDFNFEGISGDM